MSAAHTPNDSSGEDGQAVRFLPERRNRRARVVVIGAGCAGLSAARELLPRLAAEVSDEEGADNGKAGSMDGLTEGFVGIGGHREKTPLLVLEARDRIGGRVHTESVRVRRAPSAGGDVAEFPVDMGAAWVHGTGGHLGPSPERKGGSGDDDDEIAREDPTENGHGTPNGPPSGPGDFNPIVELLREAAPPSDGEGQKGDNDLICRAGLKPVSPLGNPWTHPEIMHAPLNAAMSEDSATPSPSLSENDPQHSALFVGGKRVRPDDPAIAEALRLHGAVLSAVSRVGNAAFEEGEGDATSRISVGRTIDAVRTDVEAGGGRLAYRHEVGTGTPDDGENLGEAPDGNMVETLVSHFHHLHTCWHPHALYKVQLSEYIEEGGEGGCGSGDDGGFPGPHCTVKAGMASILPPLMSGGVSDTVLCGQEVTRIERTRMESGRKDGVVVICRSGVFVEADVCIVTMPLGCLQDAVKVPYNRTRGMFYPALPDQKLEAIQALRMGSYKKVLLTFDSIFWPTEEPFLGLIREVESKPRSLGGHQYEDDNYCHYEAGLGNHLQLDNLWAKDGIPCLEATLVGEAAEWATGLTDVTIRDAILLFMEDAMSDVITSAVDDGPASLSERCVACHITRWEEDCFSRGAYSGFVLGTLDRHAEELCRPEWGGRLLFAGEATNCEYEGSIHGALLSGVDAADKALAALSRC